MPPSVAALLGVFAGFVVGQAVAVAVAFGLGAPLLVARLLPVAVAIVGGLVGFRLAKRTG